MESMLVAGCPITFTHNGVKGSGMIIDILIDGEWGVIDSDGNILIVENVEINLETRIGRLFASIWIRDAYESIKKTDAHKVMGSINRDTVALISTTVMLFNASHIRDAIDICNGLLGD